MAQTSAARLFMKYVFEMSREWNLHLPGLLCAVAWYVWMFLLVAIPCVLMAWAVISFVPHETTVWLPIPETSPM